MFNTETTYEVAGYTVGDTKAGTKMGKLQLKDTQKETTLNCILWEETLNRMDPIMFRTGNLVKIVSGSYNEKFNNALITSLELIKEAKLGLDESQQNKYLTEILKYVDKIEDEKKKNFLLDYFQEHEDKIKVCPAAKTMHHNYMGGLIVHTLECLEFADANMALFKQKYSADDIYMACILHDIGKIFEYTIDTESGQIGYDEDFKKEWLTHSQYGFTICMTQGFKQVAKMIGAHHARTDWGAIVDLDTRDLEPMVYLIHHLDDLSAKFGKTSVNDLG